MKIFKKNVSAQDRIFAIVKCVVLTLFVAICIYPFYYVIIYSVSDPREVTRSGVWFWPKGFNIVTYKNLLTRGDILPAFGISAARTAAGTALSVICTSVLAFLVTRKELLCRKFVYRFALVTMYVSGGLIPWYLTMKAYGLQNNFLLYIVPGAVNAYHMILVKTFIEQQPASLEEAAMIEGAGFWDLYWKIVMPLAKPIIATVSVYEAVGQWNSWRDNFFLCQKSSLQTMQMVLQTYLKSASALERMFRQGKLDDSMVKEMLSTEGIKMTAIVVTMAPILLVYPFAQKYFTKGIMLGAVKG